MERGKEGKAIKKKREQAGSVSSGIGSICGYA